MQIPGLRPKYQKPKSVQITGGTIHRFTHLPPLPTSSKMPPLTGPTTHLVSFKLNPCKSPKRSHPSPFPIYPPSIYIYLPHLFPFFPIKQLKLSSNLTCRIFIAAEREVNGMWTKIRECKTERECAETYSENLSS